MILTRLPPYGNVAKRFRRHASNDWHIGHYKLFGTDLHNDIASQIWDFSIEHYVFFLDNVGSLEDLLKGLDDLDPFVDDAIAVARNMSEAGFADFKLALAHEHRCSSGEEPESRMPVVFNDLVLPILFIPAMLLADKAAVSMGTALIRIMETELGL